MTAIRAEDRLIDRFFAMISTGVRRVPARGWTVLYGALVTVAFGFLVFSLTSQWFILDEFDYLTPPSGSWIGWLFEPHNEHTVVFTKLWYSTLFHSIGLRHYWLYALPMLIGHAAAYVAVVKIVTFATGSRTLARFGTLPLIVMAAGAGTLLWGGQFQYTGALAAGLWLVWLAMRRERPPVALVAVLAVFGTFSGSAFIAMGVTAGIVFFWRRRAIPAVVAAGVPAVWFVVERLIWKISDTYQVHSIGEFFTGVASFTFALIDRAVIDTTRLPSITAALGIATFIGVLVVVSRVPATWTPAVKASAVLAAALGLSLLITVVGRLGRDIEGAASGGYSYFIVILAYPALLILAYSLFRSPGATAVLVVVALGLTAVGVAGYRGQAISYASWRQGTERILEGAAYDALHGALDVPTDAVPAVSGAPTVTWARLTAWVRSGALEARAPDASVRDQLELSAVSVASTTRGCLSGEVLTSADPESRVTGNVRLTQTGAVPAALTLSLGEATRTLSVAAGSSIRVSTSSRPHLLVTSGAVLICVD